MPRWLSAALPAVALGLAAAAVAVPPTDPNAKPAANPDAQQAARQAQVAKGLTVELWAAEPLLANPVAFSFDEKGKCYVAETTRFGKGVPDTRGFMHWLDEDLAARTVADRLAMYKKHKYQGFEKYDDQVRVVWDAAGAGVATRSEVFSSGYNRPEDGLAAGVLARKGAVYLANIPSLYRLRDADGDGKADDKAVLHTGYGVRAQFLGHDLHGLVMGPDGKLYFSIGDRGLHVVTADGKTVSNPDSGCVLRCDPDGRNLEIVHAGLRNPQELAFDDFGNLFTYDNNSDSGDRARWVQIVEGGDSGWRAGYQYGSHVHHAKVPQGNRGPWNAEGIWHTRAADGSGPPAYVVPPLAHFGNGPAGITAYPGVGLSDRYAGHFFACDFTASAGGSKIWSLAVKPKGAGFEVTDLHEFVRQMVPTDCDFGPDGAFYWSDWTGGWNPPNKGRIFRLTDPEAMKNPAVAEAKKLLAEGFSERPVTQLARLLGHPHRQVRLEAQYELAERCGQVKDARAALDALADVAKDGKPLLARVHAVWGLGAVARTGVPAALAAVCGLAADPEPAMRAAVARALVSLPVPTEAPRVSGRLRQIDGPGGRIDPWLNLYGTLTGLVADKEPRVQAVAAVAFGRLLTHFDPNVLNVNPASEQFTYTPLLGILKRNADADPYLRQAAVQGLVLATQNPDDLFRYWKAHKGEWDTPAVRLGVVLALRKLGGRNLADFLADDSPAVAAEAARAIYDENVTPALPALAAAADKTGLADAVAYRALAAGYRLGTPADAARVAGFAARPGEPDHLRVFALKLLADWVKPPRRDPVTGLVFDLPTRDKDGVGQAVAPLAVKLFAGPDAVRAEAVRAVQALQLPGVGAVMAELVSDARRPAGVRAEALFALEALKAPELPAAVKAALGSPEARLRAAARVVTAKADPAAAVKELPALLDDPAASPVEKQMALGVLGGLKESKEADAALAGWLDRYIAGQVPDELKLDVLEAAQTRATAKNLKLHAPLREKLQKVDQAARAAEAKDPLARSREALAGGDPDKGRALFLASAAVYCQRCHKLDGQGGEVGPPLNGIGKEKTRDYLLESILSPNKQIAKGYESVLLTTVDGKVISGVLRAKTAQGYTVVTADGKVVTVPKDDVDAERPDKSAMPDDLAKKLTKRELRDLVEFLASLKTPPPAN